MKRTIALFLMLTLVLALSACGQNTTEKTAAGRSASMTSSIMEVVVCLERI